MILADAGALIAMLNVDDQYHAECDALWDEPRGPLLVSPLVVAEVCYFLSSRSGPQLEADFLKSFTTGELILAKLVERDMARMEQLVRKYADFGKTGLGGADASVVALAERLSISEIATVDHRHFSVVRPRDLDAFTLLPEGLKPPRRS